MLNVQVSIENEKVVIKGLQNASGAIARRADIGMGRIVAGIFDHAHTLLRGPSRSRTKMFTKNKKTGKRKRAPLRGTSNLLGARPGSYPVPRVTAHLLNLLSFVKPGETKTTGGQTFRAGHLNAIVYNAAGYARNIHDGTGTSAKYGPRRFLIDALQKYDQGARIKAVMEEEIQKAIKESEGN